MNDRLANLAGCAGRLIGARVSGAAMTAIEVLPDRSLHIVYSAAPKARDSLIEVTAGLAALIAISGGSVSLEDVDPGVRRLAEWGDKAITLFGGAGGLMDLIEILAKPPYDRPGLHAVPKLTAA